MIKTLIFLTLTVAIWASMILICTPLLVVAYAFDKLEGRDTKHGWFKAIWYATDIGTNVIQGGYERTTVSAEIGNRKLQGSRGGILAAKIVDYIWLKLFKEPNHCVSVMEQEDEYRFSPFKALSGAAIYLLTYFYIVVALFAAVVHSVHF